MGYDRQALSARWWDYPKQTGLTAKDISDFLAANQDVAEGVQQYGDKVILPGNDPLDWIQDIGGAGNKIWSGPGGGSSAIGPSNPPPTNNAPNNAPVNNQPTNNQPAQNPQSPYQHPSINQRRRPNMSTYMGNALPGGPYSYNGVMTYPQQMPLGDPNAPSPQMGGRIPYGDPNAPQAPIFNGPNQAIRNTQMWNSSAQPNNLAQTSANLSQMNSQQMGNTGGYLRSSAPNMNQGMNQQPRMRFGNQQGMNRSPSTGMYNQTPQYAQPPQMQMPTGIVGNGMGRSYF